MSRQGLPQDLSKGRGDSRHAAREEPGAGLPTVRRPHRRLRSADHDERIAAILLELAELGRRIGRRAADLTHLAEVTRRPSIGRGIGGSDSLASAAASVAAAAAGLQTTSRPEAGVSQPAARPEKGHARRYRHTSPVATAATRAVTADRRRSSRATPRPTAEKHRWRIPRRWAPMVTSSVAHAAAIVVLSLLFLRGPTSRAPIALEFGTAEEPVDGDLVAIDLTPSQPFADDTEAAVDDAADALVTAPLPEIDAPQPTESLAVDGGAADLAALDGALAIGGGDLLADVGGGTGTAPGAGGAAADPPTGRVAATFFGRAGEGKSVCFLCDNSNSYRDGGFHMVLAELARAVDGLRSDQSFFVVFFSDTAYPLFHPAPARALAAATPDNKRRLRAWLETVEMCRGGQGIHDAVPLAASLGPDVVYLLSDGQMHGSVVDRVSGADFGDAIVHTFGMQQSLVDRRTGQIDADRVREQEGWNHNLLAIATAHGGGFTPVVVPPPAAALERLRPIARNRSRGAVWGLRL